MDNPPHPPRAITLWVLICSFLTCLGWTLSALHHLDLPGYGAALLAGAIILAAGWKISGRPLAPRFNPAKLRRRFRRPFAGAFLALATLALAGGIIYAPTNYDALSYRLPRVLHWLAEGRWHWVHTLFLRLNTRACGIEWISAPLMLFCKNDRLLFLINIISFFTLPGLVFSVFTRLGVRPRAAWHWMWLVPTGYCFLLQAGSIGNDMFGAVWGLAALDFALRAGATRRIRDLWLSCLAAALLTGAKTSNLPALLPWFVALLPALPLVKRHFISTLAVAVIAAGASFLPMAALNQKHCGDWTGQKAEQGVWLTGGRSLHVALNCVLIVEQNLVPPVFPIAKQWNAAMVRNIPPGLQRKLDGAFETGGARLAITDMQIEEVAGIGFGLTLLLLLTFAATFTCRRRGDESLTSPAKAGKVRDSSPRLLPLQWAVLLAAVVSLAPFLSVSGLTAAGRLITPYYCLILPVFLLWQTGDWIRKNAWWRRAGYGVFLIAALLLVVSPARPLWPAQSVLAQTGRQQGALMKRAAAVYAVYGSRGQAFAPAVKALPDGLTTLGLIAVDFPETSLWAPFGSRRIEHVIPGDTADYLRGRGVQYILINPMDFAARFREPFDPWLAEHHAVVVRTIPMTLRLDTGNVDWLLVQVKE